MLVPPGDPRSLQHPYRALGETAFAWPRNLAIILLNDAQPRTITNATDYSHILSLSYNSKDALLMRKPLCSK